MVRSKFTLQNKTDGRVTVQYAAQHCDGVVTVRYVEQHCDGGVTVQYVQHNVMVGSQFSMYNTM